MLGPRDLGVGAVQKGYPAYGKLQTGDKIVAVDGKKASPLNSPKLIAAHKCAGKPVQGCRATTPAGTKPPRPILMSSIAGWPPAARRRRAP